MLDLGCGDGEFGLILRTRLKLLEYTVGLDIDVENVRKSKNKYHDVILGDVRKPPFRDNSFDVVCMFEVLDHLEKRDAIKVLDNLEKLAKRLVILSCPHGSPRGVREETNIWQRHRSDWFPNELRSKGYKVLGYIPSFIRNLTIPRKFLLVTLLFPFLPFLRVPAEGSWQLIAYKLLNFT